MFRSVIVWTQCLFVGAGLIPLIIIKIVRMPKNQENDAINQSYIDVDEENEANIDEDNEDDEENDDDEENEDDEENDDDAKKDVLEETLSQPGNTKNILEKPVVGKLTFKEILVAFRTKADAHTQSSLVKDLEKKTKFLKNNKGYNDANLSKHMFRMFIRRFARDYFKIQWTKTDETTTDTLFEELSKTEKIPSEPEQFLQWLSNLNIE